MYMMYIQALLLKPRYFQANIIQQKCYKTQSGAQSSSMCLNEGQWCLPVLA